MLFMDIFSAEYLLTYREYFLMFKFIFTEFITTDTQGILVMQRVLHLYLYPNQASRRLILLSSSP